MSEGTATLGWVTARNARHDEARRLRERGMPLRQIALAVGASLGSVSVWTRDVRSARQLLESVGAEPLAGRRLPIASMTPLRRCAYCGVLLPAVAFNRGQFRCRRCFRAYFRERGDVHRSQSGRALTARRRRAKQHVLDYLQAHPCVECGEADPVVLEFDHIQVKRVNVSKLAHDGATVDRLDEEIALCQVVCACCHRRRTAARRPPPKAVRPGRARNAAYVAAILGASSCIDCGETDSVVLDFDHVGPKTADITTLVRREASLQRLVHEIAQCVVRCANCHRRRTSEVGGHFRSQPS